ncbi:hypothetical protein KFK09_009708 [Dendrobium nobile]|uniref:Uncharacterized protein n=1 Tax=Dendrobium nobile TaxID=94219 RepID=A0A8T3BKI2_DENNO|nr:hypothetical protein KFK09_009708 [Dendrobium nobile]
MESSIMDKNRTWIKLASTWDLDLQVAHYNYKDLNSKELGAMSFDLILEQS